MENDSAQIDLDQETNKTIHKLRLLYSCRPNGRIRFDHLDANYHLLAMKYLPLPVAIIAGTVLCTQISFSLFDAAWGDTPSENNFSEQSILSAEQISSILAVADPTDILEPTAAGEAESHRTCRTGKIVAKDHPDSHHDSYYVAYKEDGSL
ncbi:MAG: hypothetical protein GY861_20205, partial [bacterium]|nr:hypothetical protein [bacterium]